MAENYPKHGKRNRHPDPGSSEISKKDEQKSLHPDILIKLLKLKTKRES